MTKRSTRISNPFPPVYDKRSRILILGSLPSEASRAAGFYYMNPRNRFWKMLSSLLDEDFTILLSAEEKTAALLRHNVALSDVILSCTIHRSADASIKDVVCTDVEALVSDGVKKIFLNGKKAYDLFLKHFPQYEAIASCMPSTSPANAKLSPEALTKIWGDAILPYLQ